MMEWYSELDSLELVFFWISIVASVFLIVQIIMLIVSFGGGDLDADGSFDMDGDMDTDGGLAFFSVKSLTAFFALGGWCGFVTATYVDNVWLPILISVLTGTIALVGVAFAMRGIAKLQCSGNLNTEKLVGMNATVYVSVPEGRKGRGKITLTAQGKYMEIDAVTDGERISVDEQVVIRKYTDDFAVVEKLSAQEDSGNKAEKTA